MEQNKPAKRNGCRGCLVTLVIMIGLLKIVVSNSEDEWAQEKQERLETHQRLLPQYTEPMQEAARAFSEGDFAKAQDAFFEAERFAQSVERDHDFRLYDDHGWGERYVSATLGRAACLVEQGDEEAASALIRKMLDEPYSEDFPVNSPKSEALLDKIGEEREERGKEKVKDPDEAIRQSLHDEVNGYMEKLNGYSPVIEGERMRFGGPGLVRSPSLTKDTDGVWHAVIGWNVWVEGDTTPIRQYAFVALLAHEGRRWKITKRWMVFADGSRYELGGEVAKMIPDM